MRASAVVSLRYPNAGVQQQQQQQSLVGARGSDFDSVLLSLGSASSVLHWFWKGCYVGAAMLLPEYSRASGVGAGATPTWDSCLCFPRLALVGGERRISVVEFHAELLLGCFERRLGVGQGASSRREHVVPGSSSSHTNPLPFPATRLCTSFIIPPRPSSADKHFVAGSSNRTALHQSALSLLPLLASLPRRILSTPDILLYPPTRLPSAPHSFHRAHFTSHPQAGSVACMHPISIPTASPVNPTSASISPTTFISSLPRSHPLHHHRKTLGSPPQLRRV
ncbi:uncharacterized protein PAN0_001d0380 [Moesziomyces antarcticus]|uniref:uncharacterized protein n=1 Tax=Pseudozyma antarctica TaxID=84753 RepID=UPI0007195A44|nr:uncharacterized protein PAN0_001d0380 [Moesziomyces antarcticus]GAK62182.1 hypothetical protein PAN0_001d0380 [Moesziomyces antarcticus]